ncbi:MAG: VWA domain-containing protein [Proteobacteria bacterium]|nr:VWA domain-containing protein [Pseudomonadota bacterium]MBU1742224.1 VWA domain-containing protein [Pseudomonadota bacterium]
MSGCRRFHVGWITVSTAVAFVLTIVLGLGVAPAANKTPLKIEGKTTLLLRVLTRPYSNIYAKAEPKAKIVVENVPAFTPYYVYEKPKTKPTDLGGTKVAGWYQVGTRTKPLGWMKAADVMEWKQAMVLAFTNPANRDRVLFFNQLSAVQKLIKDPNDVRSTKVKKIYDTVATGKIPADFPVISIEPKKYVDIATKFYLLPVLYAAEVEINERPATILKVTSATLTGGRGRSDIRQKPDPKKKPAGTLDTQPASLKKMGIDVVFVIDATNSMGPYIDATRKIIGDMATMIREKNVQGKLRFGLVAYRDNVKIVPGLEFTAKVFCTLEQGATPEGFVKKTAALKAATVGSGGFQEDVWAGMLVALKKIKWSKNALKFVILIGDAPAHQPGSAFSTTGLNASELRRLANAKHVMVLSLHLLSPQGTQFHAQGRTQFTQLTMNPGTETAAYFPIKNADQTEFAKAARAAAEAMVGLVSMAAKGQLAKPAAAAPKPKPGAKPQPASTSADIKKTIARLGYAAQVVWLGKTGGTQAPRDITAWVIDKDLAKPAVQSLRVCLLINKSQLSDLQNVLKAVMDAGLKARISGTDFFTQLKGAAAAAGRDPNKIRLGRTLGKSGLMPEYLLGLPYKSRIMSLTTQMWSSWSTDQQQSFLQEIDAKIKAYQAYHDDTKLWIPLHKGDDAKDYVMALDLDALP